MLDELLREDDEQVVWWGTWTKCAVAVSRPKKSVCARLDRP
jgi:hypothetical protein